jgi:hypothetical protein
MENQEDLPEPTKDEKFKMLGKVMGQILRKCQPQIYRVIKPEANRERGIIILLYDGELSDIPFCAHMGNITELKRLFNDPGMVGVPSQQEINNVLEKEKERTG